VSDKIFKLLSMLVLCRKSLDNFSHATLAVLPDLMILRIIIVKTMGHTLRSIVLPLHNHIHCKKYPDNVSHRSLVVLPDFMILVLHITKEKNMGTLEIKHFIVCLITI